MPANHPWTPSSPSAFMAPVLVQPFVTSYRIVTGEAACLQTWSFEETCVHLSPLNAPGCIRSRSPHVPSHLPSYPTSSCVRSASRSSVAEEQCSSMFCLHMDPSFSGSSLFLTSFCRLSYLPQIPAKGLLCEAGQYPFLCGPFVIYSN